MAFGNHFAAFEQLCQFACPALGFGKCTLPNLTSFLHAIDYVKDVAGVLVCCVIDIDTNFEAP